MADVNARDTKLIQYLNEAYGKERQLETALTAHIGMATRATYKRRLRDHLRETKNHAKAVERRIKQLGGTAEAVPVPGPEVMSEAAARVTEVAQRGIELARGPLHAARGTSEPEKQLKNAKTEYSEEAEEIATYTAIEALASTVGDRETATLAKQIKREEQRMASFLEKLIPQLTREVAQAEIPASERNGGARRRTRPASSSRRTSGTTSRSGSARRSSRAKGGSSRRSTSGRSSKGTASGRKTARSGRTTARAGARKTARSGAASSRRATTAGKSSRSSRGASSKATRARSSAGRKR